MSWRNWIAYGFSSCIINWLLWMFQQGTWAYFILSYLSSSLHFLMYTPTCKCPLLTLLVMFNYSRMTFHMLLLSLHINLSTGNLVKWSKVKDGMTEQLNERSVMKCTVKPHGSSCNNLFFSKFYGSIYRSEKDRNSESTSWILNKL